MAGTTITPNPRDGTSSRGSSTVRPQNHAAATRQEIRNFRRDITIAHLERRVLERQRRSLRDSIYETEKETQACYRIMANIPMHRLKRFLFEFFMTYREARVMLEWFKFGSSVSAAELRHASADSLLPLFNCNDRWKSPGSAFDEPESESEAHCKPIAVIGEQSFVEIIAKLQKDESVLKAAGLSPPPSSLQQSSTARTTYTEILSEIVEQCRTLHSQHSRDWTRESSRRRRYDILLNDFINDHDKLIVWCRQQQSTLAQLQSPQDIKDFCASFHMSTGVMESNFLVLIEMSEALLPHALVEQKLSQVAAVWLELELTSFEKLRAVLLDAHIGSGLEGNCREWPEYSRKVRTLLVDAEKLLQTAMDNTRDLSARENFLAPALQRCRKLLEDHAAHLLIVEHLAEFSLREECTKEHYVGIKKTALSKLTLLTQAFPGLMLTMDYPKKKEYNDAMAELGDWIEVHSTLNHAEPGAPWNSLLERIDTLKSDISRYRDHFEYKKTRSTPQTGEY